MNSLGVRLPIASRAFGLPSPAAWKTLVLLFCDRPVTITAVYRAPAPNRFKDFWRI
jgi:hypothetical protein